MDSAPDEPIIITWGLVQFKGKRAELTPNQTRIMDLMNAYYGLYVKRVQIYDHLVAGKHMDFWPNIEAVQPAIIGLRRKLLPIGLYIKARNGIGYMLTDVFNVGYRIVTND